MTLVTKGKTKDVYKLDSGNYLLKFKDDATGADGVFDPGENSVALTIKGLGRECLAVSQFFFNLLESENIPTHFVEADPEQNQMIVKPAQTFGKGLEVVVRFKATGSFIKRYGDYIKDGSPLPALVEFTIKSDEKNDPPITGDSLAALNILTRTQYEEIKALAKKTARLIEQTLKQKSLTLYDLKMEFGLINQTITLIDEISPASMRVYKDGSLIPPMNLSQLILT
jgi:phosphoribosylaminoimidazole-succinocarboxamide synthase